MEKFLLSIYFIFVLPLKAQQKEILSISCIDNSESIIEYTKVMEEICVKDDEDYACFSFFSKDELNKKYVIEINSEIQIIDFKKKRTIKNQNNVYEESECETNSTESLKQNSLSKKDEDLKVSDLSKIKVNSNKNQKIVQDSKLSIGTIIFDLEENFDKRLKNIDSEIFRMEILELKKLKKELKNLVNSNDLLNTSKRLKKIEKIFSGIDKKVNNSYYFFYEKALLNYKNKNYEEAKKNINLAKRYKPDAKDAKVLKNKILELPIINELEKNIYISKKENNLSQELELLISLSGYKTETKISQRIKELKIILKKEKFEKVQTIFYEEVNKNNFIIAKELLNKLKKIDSSRDELNILTEELSNKKLEFERSRLYLNFQKLSEKDKWEEALEILYQLKKVENNSSNLLNLVKKSEKIIGFQKDFKEYIKNSHRLINEKFRFKVNDDLEKSKEYLSFSSSLKLLHQDLLHEIKIFDVKVPVRLISDNMTNIIIRELGTIGFIKEKIINLHKGKYLFQGSKKGFKDKILDLDLTKSEDNDVPIELEIICDEQI